MNEKILLVINLKSGRGRAKTELPSILEFFSQRSIQPRIYITQPSKEETYIAIQENKDVDLVVAMGGDGTLNEAISGLMRIKHDDRPALGFVPTGTTNDFARTLGLEIETLPALEQILEKNVKWFDVGRINKEYFSYIASFGTFTSTSYDTPQALKNTIGHLAYILSGVKELAMLEEYYIRVRTGDIDVSGNYLFGSISNSTSIGGLLSLDQQDVNLRDGYFEMMLIKRPKTLNELRLLIDALTNQNYSNSSLIEFYQTKFTHFFISQDIAWSIDGEKSAIANEFVVETLHRQLPLCLTKVAK